MQRIKAFFNSELMMLMLLFVIFALGCALTGCRAVDVQGEGWNAHYLSVLQFNDVRGLSVKAGENTALTLEQSKSSLDPAAQDALRTAASALAAAARACTACAGASGSGEVMSGGVDSPMSTAACTDCEDK